MAKKKTVGDRVKEIREFMGWTVREVARRSGIDPATISKIETGAREATESQILKLADALRVTPARLLEG